MPGPLSGLRVIEMAGIGPCPLAGQFLGDLGAEVILVERKPAMAEQGQKRAHEIVNRNKRSIALDLKKPEAIAAMLKLVASADILIEGFRPGVMERLGLGPDTCLSANPKLIYGRMTGWGQDGPLSQTAGHDLNYLSITGYLSMLGEKDRPPMPPLNLVADYGGGTMFLLFGILAAHIEAVKTGKGQVVDVAMCDGVSAMLSLFHQARSEQIFGLSWRDERQANLLDGGAPFYRCYQTADGKYLSVAPLEPKFFAELAGRLDLPQSELAEQYQTAKWEQKHQMLETLFVQKSRDEWQRVFADSDACVMPVLGFDEAFEHTHNKARETHIKIDGVVQAAPVPKFSNSKCSTPNPPEPVGHSTQDILRQLDLSDGEVKALQG